MTETSMNDIQDLRELELLIQQQQFESALAAAEERLQELSADLEQRTAEWSLAEDRWQQANAEAYRVVTQTLGEHQKGIFVNGDVRWQQEHPAATRVVEQEQWFDRERQLASGRMTNSAVARQNFEVNVQQVRQALDGARAELDTYRQRQQHARLEALQVTPGVLEELLKKLRGGA